MERFIIYANDILLSDTQAFYHTIYTGYNQPNNPNYINTLKNTFNNTSNYDLESAAQQLRYILFEDLPQISKIIGVSPLTVSVIPRAKAENHYSFNQLLFKKTVQSVVNQLKSTGFIDGINYIIRHTDTKTTHLAHSQKANQFAGEGSMPYKGITDDTCYISDKVQGQNILLIDDVYTKDVGVDEDAIQTLLDMEAQNVYFYAVAKTINRGWSFQSSWVS